MDWAEAQHGVNFLKTCLILLTLLYFRIQQIETLNFFIDLLASNDRVSLTEHHSTNEVFSFGRDQGLYGRILNQTFIVEDSINVRNDHEVSGFCFTPQDGNSILSSIAATVRFLNPHSYQDKINSLGGFFFDRV